MNGYNGTKNQLSEDYSKKNFLDDAFSKKEQKAIKLSKIENKDNTEYGTNGGRITKDKVFLLSESDVCSEEGKKYGFSDNQLIEDEAKRRKSSTYAKSMQLDVFNKNKNMFDGNSYWWLRTPGKYPCLTEIVLFGGYVFKDGDFNDYGTTGLCPAMYLKQSCSNQWSYAGTVSSDGSKHEVKPSKKIKTVKKAKTKKTSPKKKKKKKTTAQKYQSILKNKTYLDKSYKKIPNRGDDYFYLSDLDGDGKKELVVYIASDGAFVDCKIYNIYKNKISSNVIYGKIFFKGEKGYFEVMEEGRDELYQLHKNGKLVLKMCGSIVANANGTKFVRGKQVKIKKKEYIRLRKQLHKKYGFKSVDPQKVSHKVTKKNIKKYIV